MYRVRSLKNGTFQFHMQNGPAFVGSRLAITTTAVDFGVDADELEFALAEMVKLDHDYAEFGIYGTFLFSDYDKKLVA